MSESGREAYLQHVLSLDARTEPEAALQMRREHLQPAGVIQAELAEGDDDDAAPRARMLVRLQNVRRDFWRLGDETLSRELAALQNAAHVDVATAAARLRQAADQRQAVKDLTAEAAAHPVFMKALTEILVAPASEANRLREREHRCMRPEQNEHYETARRGVQDTARLIRNKYPGVFALEEAWLSELLQYNPLDETEDEAGYMQVGLAAGGLFVLIVFVVIGIVAWIFS
ncbi:MAG: hypothetical protein RIC55_03000 [Pirellulaceae bacterium]